MATNIKDYVRESVKTYLAVVKAQLATKASTAVATTSAAGLMSAADKTKLDGLSGSSGGTATSVVLTPPTQETACDGLIITTLDGATTAVTVNVDINCYAGYFSHRFKFTPQKTGSLVMVGSSPSAVTSWKLGTACSGQEKFRVDNNAAINQTVAVTAGQALYLNIFNWDVGGFKVDLDCTLT